MKRNSGSQTRKEAIDAKDLEEAATKVKLGPKRKDYSRRKTEE